MIWWRWLLLAVASSCEDGACEDPSLMQLTWEDGRNRREDRRENRRQHRHGHYYYGPKTKSTTTSTATATTTSTATATTTIITVTFPPTTSTTGTTRTFPDLSTTTTTMAVTPVPCNSEVKGPGARYRDLFNLQPSQFHYFVGLGDLGDDGRAGRGRRAQTCQNPPGGCFDPTSPDSAADLSVEYQAPTSSATGFVRQEYEGNLAVTNLFGGSSLNIFYQGDVCPTVPDDRPPFCYPGVTTPDCSAANWDSRPGGNCYDLTAINVLQIILSNAGCRIGVDVGIRETNITIAGTSYPLGDVFVSEEDCEESTTVTRCFLIPAISNASWEVNTTLQFGPVSAECAQIAIDQGVSVDSLCATAAQQCRTVATNRSQSVGDTCGGAESNQVTIQALQQATFVP